MPGPVAYDSSNHFQILCQCFGSAWPRVIPYCIANVLFMVLLTICKTDGSDWGITGQGHSFAGMIVSFLIVSRINTALARYSECRNNIGTMYRMARELTQKACLFSTKETANSTKTAKHWRNEISYRALLLLRTSIAVIQYQSDKIPAWEVPELSGFELDYCQPGDEVRRHAQTKHSVFTDSMRVPLKMAYLLRQTICGHEGQLEKPLPIQFEMILLSAVDQFMGGFFGMRKFLTTPVPFPLIQMTRTIVLFYIFTIPFVFVDRDVTDTLIEHCVVVFMLTYGFMGLELVSIELDDPFGNDDNDFDCLYFTRMVFEDTYVLVHDTDGEEYADALRLKINENTVLSNIWSEHTPLLETSKADQLSPTSYDSANGETRGPKSSHHVPLGRFFRGKKKRESRSTGGTENSSTTNGGRQESHDVEAGHTNGGD